MCIRDSYEVGQYATWGGKVNVHRAPGGAWEVDSDCITGANANTVDYCREFWPVASTQIALAQTSPEDKPFTAAGGAAPTCGGVFPGRGQAQYVCCAANPCGLGFLTVGAYATWGGKVNVHRDTGDWTVDSDCSSGSDNDTVAYCRKFWPSATRQVALAVEPGNKPFTAGGGAAPECGGVYPGPGQAEYACCEPLP